MTNGKSDLPFVIGHFSFVIVIGHCLLPADNCRTLVVLTAPAGWLVQCRSLPAAYGNWLCSKSNLGPSIFRAATERGVCRNRIGGPHAVGLHSRRVNPCCLKTFR
jgi:hypothetical protein